MKASNPTKRGKVGKLRDGGGQGLKLTILLNVDVNFNFVSYTQVEAYSTLTPYLGK